MLKYFFVDSFSNIDIAIFLLYGILNKLIAMAGGNDEL